MKRTMAVALALFLGLFWASTEVEAGRRRHFKHGRRGGFHRRHFGRRHFRRRHFGHRHFGRSHLFFRFRPYYYYYGYPRYYYRYPLYPYSYGYPGPQYYGEGSASDWRNPDAEPQASDKTIRTYRDPQGRYCREYQRKIIIQGQEQTAYGTACRQPDGSWEVVD